MTFAPNYVILQDDNDQVFKSKYTDVLAAVGQAMQAQVAVFPPRILYDLQNLTRPLPHTTTSQLGPTVIVVCTSVVAVQPSRRLLSGQTFRATFSVSSTSLSAENYDPQAAVTGLNAASVGTALTETLAVREL